MNSEVNGERFILSGHNTGYKDIFRLIAAGFNKKPPHKKVTPLLAGIVWRWEALKAFFTGKDPLLTKRNCQDSSGKSGFHNSKLLASIPEFSYKIVKPI